MKKVINKSKLFYFIMGILAILIILVTGVKAFFEFYVKDEKPVVTKKELDNLELYGYTLDDHDTNLYKTYFDELKDILKEEEVDMVSYASSLTKLFVVDFYTLSNKITSSDIGGVEFVHPDMLENFKIHAGDTIYNHIKNNIYGDRKQELAVVSNVVINNIVEDKYTYNGNIYDAYKVSASWEYEKDFGYENSGVFYLIKDNNKLNVVEKTGE